MPILAACTSSAGEPTPDFGAYRRFVVDDFTFPTSQAQSIALGSDLDGDGSPDNAIGAVVSALSTQADIRDDASVRALIGAGEVPSSLEIFGSDGDDVVGLQYFATQGDGGVVLRGAVTSGGGYATPDLPSGEMTLLLPALVDADPTPLTLDYEQMQLAPSGNGAYEVRLQGLVDPTAALASVCTSLLQMIANNPAQHEYLVEYIDDSFDGSGAPPPPTMAQCEQSQTVSALLAPDLMGPDHRPYISLGIALHVFTPRNVPPFE